MEELKKTTSPDPAEAFRSLLDIVRRLRGPGGCPWDREQTHASMKPYLLEETYEVLETIDEENGDQLAEELGDLLLQIVFHASIAEENGLFSMDDVVKGINAKLVRRHPHVFGNADIRTSEEQTAHWEKLKKEEGKASALDGVPRSAPALLKAYRVQQKAAAVGFDWEKTDQVWEKVQEEVSEFGEALQERHQEKMEEEFGDLLFALVNLSRFVKINPEDAARRSTDKFIRRFRRLEQVFKDRGKSMRESTLEEMDKVWNQIKHDS
jgi:tetrapyrrole methylase family protein / MazG family protein